MNEALTSFTALALPGIPLVREGDDIARLIQDALVRAEISLQSGDVLVISSKIISKSEGRFVRLADVEPSQQAEEYAQKTGKAARLVEVILRESQSVSRVARSVLVTEHRLGFISANSAVDQSNVDETQERILLLPLDPDASARHIREQLRAATGAAPAIVISDTHGRPFRLGNVGVAIGLAGMKALLDERGSHDLFGRELVATVQGYADLVASAAHLLCGEGAQGRPVILLRGLKYPEGDGSAADLNRPAELDLYR
ncbi:MAG: coenzyme F420-0:L-glutamate ligase [Anaerolineae bacterium]|nr:coenzyme F420-0:L-glutamate ligase [Anaerolineae bacterium]